MASEDETLSGSDGEVDSEAEDDDMEKEFGHWLQQLESDSKNESVEEKPVKKRLTITPKQVMESFRNSVLLTKEGEADLDAILGDLCALEAQLTSTQSEIDHSLQKASPTPVHKTPQSHYLDTSVDTSSSFTSIGKNQERNIADMDRTGSFSDQLKDPPQWDWDDAIDSQLQGALDCLTDISTFDNEDQMAPPPFPHHTQHSQPMVASASFSHNLPPPQLMSTPQKPSVSSPQQMNRDGGNACGSPPFSSYQATTSSPYQSPVGASSMGYTASTTKKTHHKTKSNPGTMKLSPPKPCSASGGSIEQHSSSPDMRRLSGGYLSFNQDLSPTSLGGDTDSAFSDSISLPSSGSHISVATSGSGGSGGSNAQMSSGFSSADPTQQGPSSPDEQASKIKAEKIKIALEKIKQANVKKLFVRAHTADGGAKSLLVDETMTVEHVIEKLVVKNHSAPNLSWAIVEHLPDLHMERLLEDHEHLVECMMSWAAVSPNSIHFIERIDKYDVFLRPEEYLIPEKKEGEVYDQQKRANLIRDYFSETNPVCPEIDGMLYLKAEGKKSWKKYLFVLRTSGIYYNPKGKSKNTKDLVCLQKFDLADVYTSVGWKKKYKAPNEFGFALKHPQIQKKSSKYIKYLCAEDCRNMARWVTGIRIAKHGAMLRRNFETMQHNIATFGHRDVIPNPNFNDYVAQHEKVVQHFSKRGSKISHQSNSSKTGSMRKPRDRKSSLNKDNGGEAVHKSPSKNSVKSKSDINVVILDRRESTGADKDCNPNIVVLTKRDSTCSNNTSDTRSQHSLEAISQHPQGYGNETHPESYRLSKQSVESEMAQTSQKDTGSHQRKNSDFGSPTSRHLGSPSSSKPISPSPVAHNPDYTLSGSPLHKSDRTEGDDFKHVPMKMIPSLPVNTQITKYLTEQTGVAGTLNRQTLRRMKKSMSHDKTELDESASLPPPPIDLLEPANCSESPLGSPALPPPPSQEILEGMDQVDFPPPPSSLQGPPQVSKKPQLKLEQLFDASGYMTVKSAATKQATGSNPQLEDQSHYMEVAASKPHSQDVSVANDSVKCYQVPQLPGSIPANRQGTLSKRGPPPPPPKRKPTINSEPIRESHYAVASVSTSNAKSGYDTPKSPIPVNQPNMPLSYTVKQHPRECYGTNIQGFVSDLSRVVQGKHTRMGKTLVKPSGNSLDSKTHPMAPPEPPPPRPEGKEPLFVPEDLPPPPAELLEELKVLRQKHRHKMPPPVPKRVSHC